MLHIMVINMVLLKNNHINVQQLDKNLNYVQTMLNTMVVQKVYQQLIFK